MSKRHGAKGYNPVAAAIARKIREERANVYPFCRIKGVRK